MNRSSGIKISVVVCTYNRSDLLPGCLASLAGQTLEKGLYEVLVVDNNSTDGTRRIAEEFVLHEFNFVLIGEPLQGLSHARNRGWLEARGGIVAYLDDDAKAAPDWCERIVRAFDEVVPPPIAVGGEIRPFYETEPPAWFLDAYEIRTWGTEAGFLAEPRAKYGFSGSNMAFPKEVLSSNQGFCTALGMQGSGVRLGEDTELFLRLHRTSPLFWYDPAIYVLHWVPKKNMRLRYRFLRSIRSGQALARMQGERLGPLDYLSGVRTVVTLAVKGAVFLVNRRPESKRETLQRLEALGHLIGQLTR